MGILLAFTVVNALGAGAVGKAKTAIVGIKVAILIGFVALGIRAIEPARLAPTTWPGLPDILFGAGILFVGDEGFGLVTNAAGNMADPRRRLPRALFLAVSLTIVIYVAGATTAIGTLSIPQLLAAQAYALAEAAKPMVAAP